jgi:hypothetical protein
MVQRRVTGNDTSPLGLGYTPDQIRTAYSINSIASGNNGAGQAIAIVDAFNDPNIFNDLDIFDQNMSLTTGGTSLYSLYGTAASVLTVYDQYGKVIDVSNTQVPEDSSGSWEVEEALDVEWAHAIAPAAHIDLVESSSNENTDIFFADETAAKLPHVSVVSNSWGEDEFYAEAAYDATFTEPAGHQGVTFLFSSGDYNTGEYPSFSPNVMSVGGTTLYLNPDNSIAEEDAWSTSYGYGWGTGGGTSLLESEPSYQFGVQNTGYRTIPDVSLVADPFTGVAIYDSFDTQTGGWDEVGGTSVACPCWAGLMGIANAARVANSRPTFGSDGNSQAAMTALYSMPASDFHDITIGFINSADGNTYYAGPGYNEVTGRGTPVADRLVQDLANFTPANQPLDPGFEMPAQGSGSGAFTYDPTGSPWTFSGVSGLTGNGSQFTAGNPNAPEGNQVAFLQQSNSRISQSLNFAAGSYVIMFEAAQRAIYQSSFQTIGVEIDSHLVGTIQPNSTRYSSYCTNEFNVAAGNHTVELVGLDPNGGDNTAFIDQVVIKSAVADLPFDPGFEMPAQGSGPRAYVYRPTGSPWTFTGGAGLSGNGSAFTAGNLYAPQGSQVAFLQENGAISQVVTCTAGSRVITFDAAQRANRQASFQTIGVYVDNNLVGTIQPNSTNYVSYSTSVFNLAAGSHTIQLVGLNPNGGDNTAFIDQVAIQSAAANQPFDPGFETPQQGSGLQAYMYRPTGSPWVFTGAAGLSGNYSEFTFGNFGAPEGSQVAFLQNANSMISQSVNFSAGTYTIRFSAAQRANRQASTQTVNILVDGAVIGTVTPTGTIYAGYTSNHFTVTAGMHTLAFAGVDPLGGDNTAFIDQVKIVAG